MKIYIAASFCYEDRAKTSERKYIIEKTVERLKKVLPGDYYLPHQLTIPNAWDISLEEWAKAVYDHDIQELDNAEVVIFLSFGKENNAGSAWEVGYTIGQRTVDPEYYNPNCQFRRALENRKVICIKMTDEPESLMITNSVDAIIHESEIESYDWENFPAYKTRMEKIS